MNVSELLKTIEVKIGLMVCQPEDEGLRAVGRDIMSHLAEVRETLGLSCDAVASSTEGDLGLDELSLPYPDRYQRTSLAVQRAYHDLRKRDYECYADLLCCQTCALSVINGDKYVYWHAQDADMFVEKGTLTLRWGGHGDEIVEALRDAGLEVEWSGVQNRRIAVSLRHDKDQGAAA